MPVSSMTGVQVLPPLSVCRSNPLVSVLPQAHASLPLTAATLVIWPSVPEGCCVHVRVVTGQEDVQQWAIQPG